ncbi:MULTISPECIES: ead/Ea22-like family protein [Pseudomonas]|uniref:Ead/Ea22-like family protein n=1 Tax=Pseudomonas paracarnis TaxID=2750625 RepID=A0ABU6BV79_9PSED|nr:ead/Ea22-like family protein [Pseudomonas paracarnis]MBW9244105.1 hypothetical protein [Pseudomonas paracarnis]MEB3783732.1 ead/Ea22-like family protein [Pseudomonas paracarnis]
MDYENLKRLAKSATRGPWFWEKTRTYGVSGGVGEDEIVVSQEFGIDRSADAFFIAAASPSTVLLLISEIERLTAHIADGMDCKAVAIQGMARLTAENKALLKDGERYRWLRNRLIGVSSDWDDSGNGMLGLAFKIKGDRWIGCDENIDDAMSKGLNTNEA